jgi:hypothetical protein
MYQVGVSHTPDWSLGCGLWARLLVTGPLGRAEVALYWAIVPIDAETKCAGLYYDEAMLGCCIPRVLDVGSRFEFWPSPSGPLGETLADRHLVDAVSKHLSPAATLSWKQVGLCGGGVEISLPRPQWILT